MRVSSCGAQYTALRGELTKRAEFRQRPLEITLVSAVAILTITLTGTEFARILLASPILVMFLELARLHHGLRMSVPVVYIKTDSEPEFPWRHHEEETPSGAIGFHRRRHRTERPLDEGRDPLSYAALHEGASRVCMRYSQSVRTVTLGALAY